MDSDGICQNTTNSRDEIHGTCDTGNDFSKGKELISERKEFKCQNSKLSGVSELNSTNDCTNSLFFDEVDSEWRDLDIAIDRVRAVTLKVPVEINSQVVNAVVDTGAEVTVMSESVYDRIPEGDRPRLYQAKRNLIVAEAGRKRKTSGVADVVIKIGSMQFEWSIYLLGCDIIDDKYITINTRRGLEVQCEWVNCDVIRKAD